jgi:methyltransferase
VIFYLVLSFYIIQRSFELVLNARNEKILKKNYNAVEADSKDSIRMKLFHISWFIALIFESIHKNEILSLSYFALITFILIICQVVRFWTINKLKEFWTIKVYRMNYHEIVTTGLYRYFRHPNYMAVMVELCLVPMLFKAYLTSITFSLINIYILKMRINLEESILSLQSDYKNKFSI